VIMTLTDRIFHLKLTAKQLLFQQHWREAVRHVTAMTELQKEITNESAGSRVLSGSVVDLCSYRSSQANHASLKGGV